jgi:outer membrane receptor protein involved in Fe transport
MTKIYKILVLMMILTSALFAQGLTSAAINGTITDDMGDNLPGANIVAVHVPSGTQYGVSSRDNGRYDLSSLRTGGPYQVTVSYVGFTPQTKDDVFLKLSQNMKINFVLSTSTVELTDVTVIAEKNAILSEGRTGASQNVSSKDMQIVPTINRQFQDFSKLAPQFSGSSSSAAGRNNRYNNIQIDGTQHNDLFGLGSSGTPGGQVNTSPISLDAIEEFQVVIAPYDVRFSGFTGGGINAITKSGTNKFHASIYGFGRNESFVGDAGWLDENSEFSEFSEYQYGLNIGGPVIKDKLFFFISGELSTRNQPFTNQSLQGDAAASNKVSADRMSSVLKGFGYDPEGYGTLDAEQPSNKLFVRLDYNLSNAHKLTLRHNFVDADRDFILNRTSSSTLAFNSSNYNINSTTNSTAAQLNSRFGNNMVNELTVGFTTIRDRRAGIGSDLPQVQVDEGSLTLFAGPDRYSSANELDQDIIEITDNFTYLVGDHAITFGTHNEFFSFRNLFVRSFFGFYEFDSIDDLAASNPAGYQRSFSRTSDPNQAAEFSVSQFGFYIQDEWSVLPNLKLTGGIRLDIPTLPDTPENNPLVSQYFPGYSTEEVPDGNLLFSPRLGFNWDVSGDRTTQVRGGLGIFTGRIPYVWMSNNYGSTGTLYAEIRGSGTELGFSADPYNQPGVGAPGTGSPNLRSEVDLVDKDFKFPQVLRFNAAVDRELPYGFVGTFELLYSKSVNDLVYEKINLEDPTGTIADDGRTLYGGTNSGDGNFYDVLQLTNTNEGYQFNASIQLQRSVARGISTNFGYTFGKAEDLNSVLSSQARSQMRYNPIDNDPNNPSLTTSSFEVQHRFFASIGYAHEFFKNAPTTISIFYNGQSGRPYSFTVDNDLNNDGFDANDLFYIPADPSEILLGRVTNDLYEPASQSDYDALFSFIDNNDYLKDNKGKMSERNGARNPWSDVLDLRIAQDIPDLWGMGHFQLTLDVLNVLNLIDSASGWVERTAQSSYEIVDWTRAFDPASGRPVYSFNKRDNNTPYDPDDLNSRWAMQLGLRYSF